MNYSSCKITVGISILFSTFAGSFLTAAPLYSESFDSQATAKVLVNKQADAEIFYVDYSAIVRNQAGAGGPVTVRIPEAPNRIAGSAATKGVLLNATYGGAARTVNLLAAATPGGAAVVFSGNYKMSCDMWLSLDPTATAANDNTTEAGLFGVGQTASFLMSRITRNNNPGVMGWVLEDNGALSTGDVGFFSARAALYALDDGPNFNLSFPQGRPYASAANNHWVQVEIVSAGGQVSLFLNGLRMGPAGAGSPSGFAAIGYEDPFTGSITFSRNWQFGLFDNLTVESLPGPASLEAAPVTAFAPVAAAGETPAGQFSITNAGATDFSITSAVIDGANAGDFLHSIVLPLVVPAGGNAAVNLNFNPPTPNGLKVARLTLTTTDPNQPIIRLPLQASRAINSVEAALARIVSVATVGGTGTGQLTITNNNTSAVTLSAPVISGVNAAFFSVVGTFPATVLPTEALVLPINFTPTGTRGIKTATIDIATSDSSVLTLTIAASARYSFGPPLLAQYKMDETAGTTLVDSAGVSPAAALNIRDLPFGFGQASLLPGGVGTSIRLTPADTSATGNFAVSNAVHLPNVSYAMWIKPEPKTTRRTILHRSSLFTTVGTLYALYITPTGKLVFDVNSVTAVESPDGAIVDDTVYHIAVTHSDLDAFGNVTATRTRLYINGIMVAETDPLVPAVGYTDYLLNTASEGLYIGTTTSAGNTGYLGLIDDLQIYSVELDAGQISGIYSQPGKNAFNLEMLEYKITAFTYNPATGAVNLTWNSVPGAVYSVQSSTTTSGFTNVPGATGIASGGMSTSASLTGVTGDRRFYIIRRTSP
jgi:Concanavalin A-like lectin/glucanases superfamily